MEEKIARAMVPVWANSEEPTMPRKMKAEIEFERLKKRYALALIALFVWAASMMLGCCITGVIVRHNTEIRVREENEAALEAYKQEQAYQVQAEHWLSGDASREAFINQQVETAARAAGAKELKTDAQKGGVVLTILARMMNPGYPDTAQAVCEQEGQIPFYSSSNTYSQHDWDIADSILRPYFESGVVQNGLTQDFVYAEWTPGDYVLRDQWIKDSNAHYLRYDG